MSNPFDAITNTPRYPVVPVSVRQQLNEVNGMPERFADAVLHEDVIYKA